MSVHVSSNVWRSCPQKHDRLLLMIALADFANDEGVCWPSLATLAKRLRGTRRGVQRMIDALIEADEIELVSNGGGRGNSARYLLARYSEGGMCTTFEKGDPQATHMAPGAHKGRTGLGESVPERQEPSKNPHSSEHVVNIYDAYPKKVGRPAALKAIARALKSNSFDRLHELTLKFAEAVAGADPNFIPHPATWFNQERYNDKPETWTRADKKTGRGSVINASNSNADRASDY